MNDEPEVGIGLLDEEATNGRTPIGKTYGS
jgi:hypothetical protein